MPQQLPAWWPPMDPTVDPLPLLRPLGASALEAITRVEHQLLALDRNWGYLFALDPYTGDYQILNPYLAGSLQDSTALAYQDPGEVWLAKGTQIYRIPLAKIRSSSSLDAFFCYEAPFPIEGLAISDTGLYATCSERNKILRLDPGDGHILQMLQAPGIGKEQLLVRGQVLWVSDRIEETIYVLDRTSGSELARILTPHPQPTGIAFWGDQLLVAYATEETFIRDSPNDPEPLSVGIRNKTFIAPLSLKPLELSPNQDSPPQVINGSRLSRQPRASYTLSSGYRLELTYVEEFAQQESLIVPDLIWKIALPCNSLRQQVISVSPIGMPFDLEQEAGQQVAVFKLGTVTPNQSRLFGWKVVFDAYNIKFQITPEDVEGHKLPPELAARYLIDDDELAMDTEIIRASARQAIGSETNVLRKMLKIREFVYDKLSYRVTTRINPPDVVLQRGEGSCGEYVGLLLALARLNGIACRTVGRYKCPALPELINIPQFPEYNHVWIEFYLPGWGWVPMESNPDDLGERPYPQRYFMGLPWTHAEIAKGIPFETCNAAEASIGELAINHVQFRILKQL